MLSDLGQVQMVMEEVSAIYIIRLNHTGTAPNHNTTVYVEETIKPAAP
jgi:hypothetical protein